jgi:hypothetical protein
MREQANRLADMESEWTDRLGRDVEANRPLEKIVTDWTRELDRRWRSQADRQKLPYPDLFAHTLDLLDKTVRKLYESRRSELEAEAETAEQPPAEPSTEEPPPPDDPQDAATVSIEELLERLDVVLYFRDTADGRSEAVLLDGSGKTRQLGFDPGDVRAAVDAVFESIIPTVEADVRAKASQQTRRSGLLALFQRSRSLDLKVAVLVGSERVRHMMSILLRNRIETFVADWNAHPANPPLELEWEDNLELAP